MTFSVLSFALPTEIAACYGSDMSEHAINHRFRKLRAEVVIIQEARKLGLDMKDLLFEGDLPTTQGAVDRGGTLDPINLTSSFDSVTPSPAIVILPFVQSLKAWLTLCNSYRHRQVLWPVDR